MAPTTTRTKAVIGYLHPGVVRAEFMRSIVTIVRDSHTDIEAVIDVRSGPNLSAGRNNLCNVFLESCEADWLWMVDTDMVFAPSTLDALVRRGANGDLPIVGGLCRNRHNKPVMFGARDAGPDLFQVTATGAACLLIHRSVLQKLGELREHAPWFLEGYEGERYIGEDVTFCNRARAAGFPIVVDTSIKAGHMKDTMIGEATAP